MLNFVKNLFPRPVEKGILAPDFSLKDQNGKLHRLSDYRGNWVVLFFYPKASSYGCTQEACSFESKIPELRDLGAKVFGISCDSQEAQKSFSENSKISYPLLSDENKNVSKAYGVLLPIGIPSRVTFLIGPSGIIMDRLEWVNWFRYADTVKKRLEELQKSY